MGRYANQSVLEPAGNSKTFTIECLPIDHQICISHLFLFQPSIIITSNQALLKEIMASQNNQRYLKRNTLPPIVFAE